MGETQQTRIPRVPVTTPMFDEHGHLTRTWIIYFERLANIALGSFDKGVTFVLNDATPGENKTDNVKKLSGGTLKVAMINPKAGVAGAEDLVVKVYFSVDDKQTWQNILPEDGAGSAPAGDDATVAVTSGFAVEKVPDNTWWRCEVVQGANDWGGVAVQVWWL